MRVFIALLGLTIGLTSANGQEASPTCTNGGNTYQIGELACIAACHGRRQLAKCEVVANVATWTQVSNVCPSALMTSPPPDLSRIPAVAAMSPIPPNINLASDS
jgi:hypothetical protein